MTSRCHSSVIETRPVAATRQDRARQLAEALAELDREPAEVVKSVSEGDRGDGNLRRIRLGQLSTRRAVV